MYEMEGASNSSGFANSPIARPADAAEHAAITRQNLSEPRSTRCPPPRKAPLQDGPAS